MKKLLKPLSIIAAAFTFCAACARSAPKSYTALANSAPMYWSGTTASGAIIADENCPIEVESELLTFDLATFPEPYYDSEEKFLSYDGKVTARYSFYNPTDNRVTVDLAFPFGNSPSYSLGDADDTAKYNITADGKVLQRQLRHTYSSYGFEVSDVTKITDGYREHNFFNPELSVTKYKFTFNHNYRNNIFAKTALTFDVNRTKVFAPYNGYEKSEEGYDLSFSVYDGETVTVYAVGEPLTEVGVSFYRMTYSFGGWFSKEEQAEGTVSEEVSEFGNFGGLVESLNDNSAVSDIDKYNAVIDNISSSYGDGAGVLSTYYLTTDYRLMRWFTYTLEFEPHARLVNEVEAPIYPDINGKYQHFVYDYQYLLSPASGWNSFKNLEIRVNTPIYMLANDFFEKTDYGYRAFSNTLPEGELNFSLCEVENPYGDSGGFVAVGLLCLCFVGVVALIWLIAMLYMYIEYRVYKKRNMRRK